MSTPPTAVLRWVAALVAAQALVVIGFGCYLIVAGLFGAPRSMLNAELAGGLALLAGAALGWVTYGLRAGRRWSRAPAVLTQLLTLPVAWGLLRHGRPAVGAPLLAVALAALVLLFTPAATAAFQDGQ